MSSHLHRISEEVIAWDAAAILEEWFKGYMTLNDGRQYKVNQIDSEDTRLTVEVESSRYLDVEPDQFEIEIRVRKVNR
jgi:hypothetical protein